MSCFDQIAHAILVHDHTSEAMQVFLEKTGILGPVYRLMGRGLSDSEIAYDLDIPQVRVHDCIDWMRHFLHCKDHNEVAQGGLPR